jgi:hypothetical protein
MSRRAIRVRVTSEFFVRATKSVYRRDHLVQVGAAAYFWTPGLLVANFLGGRAS